MRPHPLFRLSAMLARARWIAQSHAYHLQGAPNDSKVCAELAHAVHLCIFEGLL
jgi:hypothetical protein